MERIEVHALLELLEQSLPDSGDAWPALVYLAGRSVTIDDDLLQGAVRRSTLLLAAGGDPHRELEPDSRAVAALAQDVDSAEARAELLHALVDLRLEADGFPQVAAALDRLLADPERAWRSFACTLLAAELADEEEGEA